MNCISCENNYKFFCFNLASLIIVIPLFLLLYFAKIISSDIEENYIRRFITNDNILLIPLLIYIGQSFF